MNIWKDLFSSAEGVPSIFGRTGSVIAQSGDYSATLIDNTPYGTVISRSLGNKTLSSITQAGTDTFAIVVCSSTHYLQNGQSVQINGATEPKFNGTFVISDKTIDTFKITGLAVGAITEDPTSAQILGAISEIDNDVSLIDARLINMEEITREYTIYENFTSVTGSGTVTLTTHSTIALDRFASGVDCLITRRDSNTRPIDDPARDASGTIITSTFNSSGDFTLSGIPTEDYSLVFKVALQDRYKDELNNNLILDEVAFYEASRITYDDTTTLLDANNVQTAVEKLNTVSLGKKEYHGILERATVAPLPTNLTTNTFILSTGTTPLTYYRKGVKTVVSTNKTITLAGTAGLYYIYFNDDVGTLVNSTVFPGLNGDNVLLSYVYWNGSNYGIVYDERHSSTRDIDWHTWAHNTVGCRYRSGLDFAFAGNVVGNTTFSISAGEINDEDIQFATGIQTTARIWYQSSASTYAFDTTVSTTPYKHNGTGIQAVNSAGYGLVTITASNRYFNYWVYGTTSNLAPTHIFCETTSTIGGYTSVNNARAVVPPSLSAFGLSPEYKLLYRVVVNGAGLVQTPTKGDDYRTVATVSGSVIPSTTASSVSFNPIGNIVATNVQSAIQELDAEKVALGGIDGGQTIIGGTLTTESLNFRANATDLTTGTVNFLDTLEASSTTIGAVTIAGGLAVTKKIWSTDLTVTNTITGAITGNAGTVTNGIYTTGDQSIVGVKTFSNSTIFNSNVNLNTTDTNTFIDLTFKRNGINRWIFEKDGTAETGSNVGSDFALYRYNDAGTYLGNPIFIKRDTGDITLNGNVGIGITDPSAPLTLATIGGANSFEIRNKGVSNKLTTAFLHSTNWAANTDGSLIILYDGTDASKIVLDSRTGQSSYIMGKVGIGVTAPQALIDVRGANPAIHSFGTGYLSSTDSFDIDKGGQLTFGGSYTGTLPTFFSAIAGRKENATDGSTSGYFAIYTRVNGANLTERLRISSAGNVGITSTGNQIGHVTTYRSLEIMGAGTESTASCGVITLMSNKPNPTTGNETGLLLFGSLLNGTTPTATTRLTAYIKGTLSGSGGANGFGGELSFFTKADNSTAAERFKITSDGNVGIGTLPSPAVKLHVLGSGTQLTSGYGSYFTVEGTMKTEAYFAMANVIANDAMGINVGGSLGFGGAYTITGGNISTFGIIRGCKESAVNSEYGGYLSFSTYNQGVGHTEKMRIAGNGNVGIGTSSPSSYLSGLSGLALYGAITTALGFGNASGYWTQYITGTDLRWYADGDKLVLTADGRLYGTALHNNAGAVTGTTNQYIASGTYTPTLTNGANVAASTAYVCQWMRVGNVVTVSGRLEVDTTSANTSTSIELSLPIASNFSQNYQCAGNAMGNSSTAFYVYCNPATDKAVLQNTTGFASVANDTYFFTFTYVIV